MAKNKLFIAAAGAGKTTFLVTKALAIRDSAVLITTFTLSNEAEIRQKIIDLNGFVPRNIVIQSWFSFLLQHGVKPFQGVFLEKTINGLILVNQPSGIKYKNAMGVNIPFNEEKEFEKHYFSNDTKIYSDKISKFVVKVDEKSQGSVIERVAKIFGHIFIDEVQDLSGYDLQLVKLLFVSTASVLLVGDPRQVTYLTHNERKFSAYIGGRIKEFIATECKKLPCDVDEQTLNKSYRNNDMICEYSSRLYPNFSSTLSYQTVTTVHDGIFLVRKSDVIEYLERFSPLQLRLNVDSKGIVSNVPVMNFGESKGLTFERVLIFPTQDMLKWIYNNNTDLKPKTRAQFYVALTRAKHSVAIIDDYRDGLQLKGITLYK